MSVTLRSKLLCSPLFFDIAKVGKYFLTAKFVCFIFLNLP